MEHHTDGNGNRTINLILRTVTLDTTIKYVVVYTVLLSLCIFERFGQFATTALQSPGVNRSLPRPWLQRIVIRGLLFAAVMAVRFILMSAAMTGGFWMLAAIAGVSTLAHLAAEHLFERINKTNSGGSEDIDGNRHSYVPLDSSPCAV
ncbi:hypothetical protein GQ42DRAFT_91354 [Ramicandelaber brevisporus]|nr:hypothetical protein GQ42DRAFT_21749 [Ramicandelaber brevisporus]KAI8871678.1 hypothetical protein GQ42DRAFT_91354 [Ramicandelaber brevisporus]